MIPFPFTQGAFVIGTPLWIPKRLSAHDMEAYRMLLEKGLSDVTEEADKITDRGNTE